MLVPYYKINQIKQISPDISKYHIFELIVIDQCTLTFGLL